MTWDLVKMQISDSVDLRSENLHFLLIFIHLKNAEGQRQTEIPHVMIQSPNAYNKTEARRDQSQEPGTQCGLLREWQGLPYLSHHLLPSRVHTNSKLELGVDWDLEPCTLRYGMWASQVAS